MTTRTPLPKDIRHDPWLVPSSQYLQSLSDQIARDVEDQTEGPKRKDAIERKRKIVGTLIANIVYLIHSPNYQHDNRIAIPTAMTKYTRYDHAGFKKRLITGTLQGLKSQGVILVHKFECNQRTTSFEPTPSFRSTLEANTKFADIRRLAGAETIWLSARTGNKSDRGKTLSNPQVGYKDTALSKLYRREMEEINDYLNRAEVTFDGKPQAPVFMRRSFISRGPTSANKFNLSGRLHGGFWQNLPSDQRHRLRLRGEQVADLDYVAMFANLAYLRSEAELPHSDPYAIHGLEDHRQGAKLALLSLLSRATDMRRLTQELKDALPQGWTAKRLSEALKSQHPRIEHLFGTDVSVDLMFTESRILVALLLKLNSEDIPALPMHDGIMVRVRNIDRATTAMQETSKEILGVGLPVKRKQIKQGVIL